MRYEYSKLANILEKYYRDTNYCGVASLCTATGLSVGKSYHLLRRHGRKHRKGTPFEALVNALEETGYSLETLNGKRLSALDGWRGGDYNPGIRTYGQAEKTFKRGTYLLLNATSKSAHVACIKDGILNDWTVRRKRTTVRSIFKVVKTEGQ